MVRLSFVFAYAEDVPCDGGESWCELGPGDGCYVPEGARHQYQNVSARSAVFLFAVAPSYLPVTG